MISYLFGKHKLKDQSMNFYSLSDEVIMKFAKILFTVSLSICLLLVPILSAMSRAEVQGQSSGTSTDQSTVNPINRAKAPGPMMILYGTMENANTFVPPPPLLKLSQQGSDSSGAPSQFKVTYSGFTDEEKAAFQYAVDIWDSLIRSPVPIRIDATFEDLGGYEDRSIILGGARPAGRGILPSERVWVASALIDKWVGRDLGEGKPDIITSFNRNVAVGWYFSTDGNTPLGKQDFVSVVLHEIGHGLGFFSSATVYLEPIEGIPRAYYPKRGRLRSSDPKLPEIYDIFVVVQKEGDITHITETDVYEDPSVSLKDAFESYRESKLLWNGEKGVEANSGIRPKLYAPDPWNRGSSYSHLDEDTFPAGAPNALMTPRQSRAEANHHPGPITLGMFEDMGWTINKGPAFTDGSSTTRSVAENTGADVNIGSPVTATDANSADPPNIRDSLTYTLSGIDARSFAIEGATGQLKTLAALDYETKRTYTVTVTVSDGRLIDEIAVTISVTDVDETPTNSPPAFTDGPSATRTVAENTGSGADIGGAVRATDADNDSLTYTLSGTDAAAFDIISTSGQLRTKAALDYETKNAYTVTVTVSDGSLTVSIEVTINVSNVNDVAPVFIEGPSTTRSVVENTASGVDIEAPVGATDADSDSLTYTLSGTDSASFEVDSTSGQLRTKAALDYETKAAYNTVTITVSDGSHTASITVTVEVTDVVETPANRGPVFTEGVSAILTVAENTGSGADIGAPVGATDAENDSLTYTLSGTDAAAFDIISTTGQLKTEAALDYETKNAYTVTVAVSDGSLTDSITVTITVTDVPEVSTNNAPAFTEGSSTSRSVPENTTRGVNIGNPVVATDADSSTTLIYSLGGPSASSFDIEPLSGQLKTKRTLDYETRASYTVTGTVSDGSLTDSITVTITVTDVPESPTNREPVFTEGSSTTRSVAENTRAGVNIGLRVSATDPDSGDTLTYTLEGPDTSAFDIDSTSGWLKTRTALDYEIQDAYAVTVTVTDGSLSDEITVTISVTDVPETPTNRGPVFTEGSSTTRSVAENTGAGVNIGPPVAATDADNDSLTYSLSGLDAASFEIDRTSGQLKTLAALDYETRTSYTVTVSVSDGSLTDTITVTIAVTDQDDLRSPTVTLASQPLTEATLNGSMVTLRLRERKYEEWLSDPVTASGIPGVTVRPSDIDRVSDTELRAELTFDGTDFDTDATLTFTVKADAIANYNDSALTVTAPVTAGTESVVASTATLLREATLNGSTVTLTLSGGVYEARYTVGNNVTVSGIAGVTVNRFDVERVSDTQVVVELIFDGTDFDTDAALTFTVEPEAVAGYNGAALIAQLPVIPVVEENPTITASTPQPLTEATLNQSLVTLTLNSGVYVQSSADISRAVQVAGLGVTFSRFNVARISDTQVTVPLTFDGTDFDTDATLTFTIGADAIANYNGPALITDIPVTAVIEERPTITVLTPQPFTEATLDGIILLTLNNSTYVPSTSDIKNAITVSGIVGITVGRFIRRESDTQIAVELEFNGNIDTNATLTFTVGADAIARYDGPALIVQVSVTGGTESVAASTAAALAESTLHGSVVTLTLNGATYERSIFDLRDAVEISGIAGVTYHWFDLERVSDMALTVELKFNGNIDTDAILTFTVGADAISGYNGPALITTLPVTAGQESIVASTDAPLTESTLDESVVTLTLNGANYARSTFDIRDGVTVSGIDGVTIPWHQPDRESDTVITIELEFEGNIDTDATLTVEAGALAGYGGPALIAQLPVTGGKESIVASTEAPLTEATLDGSVVTLTLNGANYARSTFDIRDGVTVSGIDGVTIPWHEPDRESDTVITIELEFNGNIDTDATLTLTVEAGALAGYGGPALIAQLPVTGGKESIVASTEAPLTEATLDGSVVTLTLNGANYARSIFGIRDGVTVSGVPGVTVGTFGIDRESDTEVTVELEFEGNIDTDATLTFTVGADAIAGYDGPALIATLPVTGGKESVVASTEAPLTAATLDGSVVTLTLIGGAYARSNFDIRDAVTVSGIPGVTIPWHDPDRKSDTQITLKLEFDGNLNADATLTFTVGADAIAGYNGPALIVQLLVTTGQTPAASLVASTQSPLTETTLDGSVVTLTLTGGTYQHSRRDIRNAVTVSGISGVTVGTLGINRVNDTVVTVELRFNGNLHVDATLIFTVGADAIANYNGPALTAILPVTAVVEAVVKENPTIAETSLMAIEGTIKTEDGIPAEAGLQVTVTVGSNTQTGVSEVGGVYTVTILNLQGTVVATSGDTVTVQVRNPNTGASVERTVQLSSKQVLAKQATIDLQFSLTPSTTDREYLLSVPTGISLIHVPLKVTAVDGVAQTIESVGDLYDALGGAATVSLLITYDPETGRWNSYLHDGYRGRPGDKTLTDDLGIIASMKVPKSVLLSGDALGTNGRSSITLHPGVNLVGVPLKDSRITRVSDLLKLNGIAGNVSVIIVSDNGFKVVAQAGDPGDIPVTGGGAFILTARNAATVEITGTKWSNPLGQTAAPSTALTGIQTDGVTPVLAVPGSISPVVGKSVSRPFHVTVKNRSTGTVDTAMTDDDGVSYQFTFVDIETSRAAQVGDILEITAHCPDPFVGVQPLRHTVTGEDVKRSWISLGELVAYEIPAKTELLSNYPNPFNPETWIPYRLAKDAFVTLTIYDRSGRVVREIDVGHRIAAVYESRSKAVHWDGRTEFGERVASGIYFYSLTAGDYSATRKMVILK